MSERNIFQDLPGNSGADPGIFDWGVGWGGGGGGVKTLVQKGLLNILGAN